MDLILRAHKEQNLGARCLEPIIEFTHEIHMPHNAIHKVLMAHGLAKRNPNKSKRRKPWVRWERDHCLRLVHLDWHISEFNGKEVCVVLDDSSRRILSGGEFDAETTENSIRLLQEALDRFGWLTSIREVMTDHGTQSTLISETKMILPIANLRISCTFIPYISRYISLVVHIPM